LTFEVRCGSIVLGHSELEDIDESMGVRSGPFRPAPGYEQFRPIFRRFANAVGLTSREPANADPIARYYQERDSLGLRLFDSTGQEVPTATIHLHDYSVEAGPDAYLLEIYLPTPPEVPPYDDGFHTPPTVPWRRDQ
jgi:hypothetical protein